MEEGESLTEAVIREMREETGLLIENPIPCGFKDWIMEDGIRYIKRISLPESLNPLKRGRYFGLTAHI